MGGVEKPLLELDGRSLIARVIERLESQVATIAISANRRVNDYQKLGFDVLSDRLADFQGPLAGILEGMVWAKRNGFSHMLSVAADTPFFPPDLCAKFETEAPPTHVRMATTGGSDGRQNRHPTFALWPVEAATSLEKALADGTRKIVAWTDDYGCSLVEFDAMGFDPFFNVNTPEDLLEAERMIREVL